MKLFILPEFAEAEKGDGGIRRVVDAQRRYLPEFDIEIVKTVEEADVVALHASEYVETSKPMILHCHGLYWSDYSWGAGMSAVNKRIIRSMRNADYVTAPSNWVADSLRRGMWLDPIIIPHGVNLEDWAEAPTQGYVLWNKTRVDAVCDPSPMNVLAQHAPDIQFVSTFGRATQNVRLIGRTTFEAQKHYVSAAGVYLVTSQETCGIGTLEAMACGVPILGWAFGGQNEIVAHKETGWLAPVGDYDSLLEGLHYCLDNRERLGKAAQDLVSAYYTWPTIIGRYAELYQAVLEPPKVMVSVVIPCYNLAQFLPEAIDSVLSQPYADLEVVVVDDASSDNTAEVVKTYKAKDRRIRYVRNKQNEYLSTTLNHGIEYSNGKYIVPLDADNLLGVDAISPLVEALENSRDIDIAYGAMQVLGGEVSGWPPAALDVVQQLSHRNQCPSTSMYRRKVWETIGGYRKRCRTAEDADFWCRAAMLGFRAKKVTQRPTLIYRDRADSMSHVQKDWPWEAWYPWAKNIQNMPYGAGLASAVPTYSHPDISVIIPVGPGHGCRSCVVLDAIDSVFAQTFTNWEVIVVNDNEDGLLWTPSFVTVLETGGGKGPAAARNLGFFAARGSEIVLLDADDYLQPTALEEMYKARVEGAYVYCDWFIQETQEIHRTGEYDCRELLRHLPHAVTAMYPAKGWRVAGGFDEELDAWEDWDFIIAMNAAGYFGVRVPLPLFQYRMHGGFRREDMYQKRETMKEHIYAKWRKYFNQEAELMACRTCGASRPKTPVPPTVKIGDVVEIGGMVLIEYIPNDGSMVTFRGKSSGSLYRFGSDAGHKVKNVFERDAPGLLALKCFRKAQLVRGEIASNVNNEPLVAEGPPRR
jgi:glycosyltransferase involved in cell wall biosynthesis